VKARRSSTRLGKVKRAVHARPKYASPEAEDYVVKTANPFLLQEGDMQSGAQSRGNKTACLWTMRTQQSLPCLRRQNWLSSMPERTQKIRWLYVSNFGIPRSARCATEFKVSIAYGCTLFSPFKFLTSQKNCLAL